MAKYKTFSWKKMIWKGVEIFVYAGIGGLISYLLKLPQTETIIAVVALLKVAQNYIKNRTL